MANVIFRRTDDSTDIPIIDGQVIFETSNNPVLFLDDGNERKEFRTKDAESVGGKTVDQLVQVDKINEYIGEPFVANLPIGETTVVFTSPKILATSTVDYYTSVYGINPINVEMINGQITLTFKQQEQEIKVKVVIK